MIFIRESKREVVIGSAIGILLSAGIILKNYGEPVSWELVILLLMSLILGFIDKKLTCLAYVTALVYLMDTILVGFKLKAMYFTLPYEKLILIVGALHMLEGLLTYLFGARENQCIINYKRNQITGGYQAYRKWYIPLFLFTIKGFYVPLLCVLVYADETYTMKPEAKAKKSGKCIWMYGSIILLIGLLVCLRKVPLVLGMIMMPIAHELLFVINDFMERGPYMYSLPKKGVRVIEINKEQKQRNNIKRGDVILKVNGKNIIGEEEYYKQLLEKRLVMMIEDLEGNKKILSFDKEEYEKLEIIILPRE